ncbi:alkyl hydroperoxide reductase [Virgibacillus phasianinus]|uniref:Alkyl hydroperoxide reductase n=1 Tax=Virgibacillus phasianinus TaxID=2017483 RepID=A0A220U6V5_9BACI|nr:TlpA disulfide reductase family protein [Virgibacillus phasianinus]ASK64034.1 alkyl hydroperoxide reductase [Virgibacillus phasianinus]
MKKAILLVIVVGMFGFAVYDFTSSTDEPTPKEGNESVSGGKITSPPANNQEEVKESDQVGLERGEIAPDFKLQTLNGETVQLSDYRGKRVLINFWATWCPPCRAEIPDLQKLYENKDVAILAVNMTGSEKSKGAVTEFAKKYGMTFPVLLDENADVTTTYQVRAYPTSYMIDSEGRIQFIALGAMNYELMTQQLEKMK